MKAWIDVKKKTACKCVGLTKQMKAVQKNKNLTREVPSNLNVSLRNFHWLKTHTNDNLREEFFNVSQIQEKAINIVLVSSMPKIR